MYGEPTTEDVADSEDTDRHGPLEVMKPGDGTAGYISGVLSAEPRP